VTERIFVSLGSNIEPEENLRKAVELLGEMVEVLRISTVYRSAAWGRPEQEPFLNAVAEIATALPPAELRDRLRAIEARLGRERSADKFAPRTLDIDLILYGGRQETQGELRLPDPEIAERPFLVVPLAELAPELRLPGRTEPVAEMATWMTGAGLTALPEYTAELQRVLRGSSEG
jgi:2-amino-4-hydroxy-6-hydroxymethyldihydropteridine diphosphokinase